MAGTKHNVFDNYLRLHNAAKGETFTNTRIGDKSLSIFGGSYTTRKDILAKRSCIAGIFGFGVGYQYSAHITNSISFNYITGKATIDLTPAKNYVPFLTQITYNLEYHF